VLIFVCVRYQKILDQIKVKHKSTAHDTAKRVLFWVTASYRPLKEHEIEAGVALRPGIAILNDQTQVRKSIVDLCYPMLERRDDGNVELVHFSVKEYEHPLI
jgi:hypothetical protein